MFSKKKNIAVFFGGVSSEHGVSLVSATTVIENLDKDKYNIHLVGITKTGRFLHYTGDINKIKTGEWEKTSFVKDCLLSPSTENGGLIVFSSSAYQRVELDCIIPVLHGKNGEDGTVQGLFQLAQIPFVGCDLLSSAVCMDKEMTHIILEKANIKTAKFKCINSLAGKEVKPTAEDGFMYVSGCDDMSNEQIYSHIEEDLRYPVFVKPANAGSSFGVSKARDKEELITALDLAFEHDKKVIVEETIIGREIECSVLGNLFPESSIAGEIEPTKEFYDYEAKYEDATSKLHIPARISEEAMEKLRKTAVKAYRSLGCGGLSRVDFFVTDNEDIVLNEINTFPGFTSISMYPKLWEATGKPIKELIDELINLAVERNA